METKMRLKGRVNVEKETVIISRFYSVLCAHAWTVFGSQPDSK